MDNLNNEEIEQFIHDCQINGSHKLANTLFELLAYRVAQGKAVAVTGEDEISNMQATGLYLRAWPTDRQRNEVEGYTIPLYAAPQLPAVPELVPVPDEFLDAEQNDRGLFELSEDCMIRLAVALSQQSKGMVIPAGKALVPRRLTAENGAKGALLGEFLETKYISCPECFGDDDCESCDGSGRIKVDVTVSWDTIKCIYSSAIDLFCKEGDMLAAAPKPSSET